jgi:hypothetical protein
MRVIADHGDVVEVWTSASAMQRGARVKRLDCAAEWSHPFSLRVFVRRDALVPRSAREIAETYSDGSGYVVDVGAPVEIRDSGLHWYEPLLDEAAGRPSAELRYSLISHAAAALPATDDPPLVCEDGLPPRPLAEWEAEQKTKYPRAQSYYVAAAPFCKLSSAMTKRPSPAVNGNPLRWPASFHADGKYEQRIHKTSAGYTVDMLAECGRVRAFIDRKAIDAAGGNRIGGIGHGYGASKAREWYPSPGEVTWRDGTPAGQYTGGRRGRAYYRDSEVEDVGNRICVQVFQVTERVCHWKANVIIR